MSERKTGPVKEPRVRRIVLWEMVSDIVGVIGKASLVPLPLIFLIAMADEDLGRFMRARGDLRGFLFWVTMTGIALLAVREIVLKSVVLKACRTYIRAIAHGVHGPKTWNEYDARVMPMTLKDFIALLQDEDAKALLYQEIDGRKAFIMYVTPGVRHRGKERARGIFTYSVPHGRALSLYEDAVIRTLIAAARRGSAQTPSVIPYPWRALHSGMFDASRVSRLELTP